MLFGKTKSVIFQGRREGIIPAVHETKNGNCPDNLDNLIVIPMSSQFSEHLIGHGAGGTPGRDGDVQGDTFRVVEQGAGLIFPRRHRAFRIRCPT
ncbi:MAG: hypothetical protein JWR80_3487 [Bradyrhizobium sp.]|nr:hypothetical protein [Bradyrhizobium sp.]